MAAVNSRTYDTIRLPGSARDSRVLVAAIGQTIHRERLMLLNQQLVTDSGYTKDATIVWNGNTVLQPTAVGGSNPYSATGETSSQVAQS